MKKLFPIILLILFPLAASAADELLNFYEVKDIPITQQGDNATAMRDKAIAEGQRKAMAILQKRLIAKNYIQDEKTVTDADINEAIDSIEVRDEKIFTRSYKAKLNVVFTPRVISKIFNVDYVKPTVAPDKYLVVPILNEKDDTKIWRHKWWDTMQAIKNKNIILPLGDLEDVRNFTKEDYNARDFRNLVKLEKKYDTSGILLAVAEYIPGSHSINLGVERIKGTDSETYNYELSGSQGDSEPQLFALAANELVKRVNRNNFDENASIEDEAPVTPAPAKGPVISIPEGKGGGLTGVYQKITPRTEATTNTEAPKTIEDADEVKPDAEKVDQEDELTDVYVIANDLISWGRIRSKITDSDLVTNIKIKSFVAGKAYVTLQYHGEFSDVIKALEQNNLVVKMNGKYWEIREQR